MPKVDKSQVVNDLKTWLPSSNALSDGQLMSLVKLTVTRVGDDSTKQSEVLCKTLRAAAYRNIAEATTSSGGLKKQRVGEVENEYFTGESVVEGWKLFIDSLDELFPLLGFEPKRGRRIFINPGESFNPLSESIADKFVNQV